MLVPQYEIQLSPAEQQALEVLRRAGKTSQQTVRRVNIVLLAHEQLSNQAIADAVSTSRNLVQKWRKRFALWEPSPLVPETKKATRTAASTATAENAAEPRSTLFLLVAVVISAAVLSGGISGGQERIPTARESYHKQVWVP